ISSRRRLVAGECHLIITYGTGPAGDGPPKYNTVTHRRTGALRCRTVKIVNGCAIGSTLDRPLASANNGGGSGEGELTRITQDLIGASICSARRKAHSDRNRPDYLRAGTIGSAGHYIDAGDRRREGKTFNSE